MLFYNGKPHCVFSQLLFYCQVYARKTICLFVLSVYVCQNNEQNHVTVDTLPMWYLAHMKNKPVILRHLVDMWFIHLGLRLRWINHISPRCLKITLTYYYKFPKKGNPNFSEIVCIPEKAVKPTTTSVLARVKHGVFFVLRHHDVVCFNQISSSRIGRSLEIVLVRAKLWKSKFSCLDQ